MGLRRSIAISLLGILTVLAALTLAVLRWDTQRNAVQLEQTEAVGDLRRLITSLDARALQVKGILMSWSNWSALYDHVAKPSREAVVQAAKHIESFVKSVGRSLDFSVDPTTGDNVLRVLNPENGEVVRQLPAEETLRIARAVDYMQCVLVNQRA